MSEETAPAMPSKPQPPYVLALIICDAVYIDPATGKKTILGVFTAVRASSFPVIFPLITVYAALTDGRGKIPITFRLTTVDDDTVVVETVGEISSDDPRAVCELIINFGNVPFPSPGEYRLQLIACGEFLMERRIVIVGPSTPEETHE